MKLTEDVELAEGLPAAYIRSIKALAISDVHLGYESAMAKMHGTLIPKVNLKKVIDIIQRAMDTFEVKQVIVTGDIKNEFSNVEADEANELRDLAKFVAQSNSKLVLIKGNHDNFIDRYKGAFNIELHQQYAELNGYYFFHGDRLPNVSSTTKMLVMGHEHPAIAVYNAIRRKQKFSCFVSGSYKRIPLLVLPAISYFAAGSEINAVPKKHFLSPVLNAMAIDNARVMVIGKSETLDFGTVRQLRLHASA